MLLWATTILWASGDTFSNEQSEGWLTALLGEYAPSWLNFVIRRSAHVVEYGILSVLTFHAAQQTWRGRVGRALAVALLLCAAVASADEFRQSRTAHRNGSPADVALDLVGASIGGAGMALRARRHA